YQLAFTKGEANDCERHLRQAVNLARTAELAQVYHVSLAQRANPSVEVPGFLMDTRHWGPARAVRARALFELALFSGALEAADSPLRVFPNDQELSRFRGLALEESRKPPAAQKKSMAANVTAVDNAHAATTAAKPETDPTDGTQTAVAVAEAGPDSANL